jgi:hypothetical protein
MQLEYEEDSTGDPTGRYYFVAPDGKAYRPYDASGNTTDRNGKLIWQVKQDVKDTSGLMSVQWREATKLNAPDEVYIQGNIGDNPAKKPTLDTVRSHMRDQVNAGGIDLKGIEAVAQSVVNTDWDILKSSSPPDYTGDNSETSKRQAWIEYFIKTGGRK